MKNSLLYKIESKVIICVKGNNIERFIHRLVNNNIELLEIKQIKYNEVNIAIYEHDYKKVLKLKTTYEISLIGEKGLIKIKHFLLKNIYLIISFLICLIILKILTNLIFQIDIIHNDKEIRNIISRELTSAGIKKYTLNKKYNEIQDIKQNILNKYKDKIEWLEIERVGTKYIIKVEERKINNIKSDDKYQDIVSTKDAVIKKIVAVSGEVVREVNEYVSKGDTIISGSVYLNGELKGLTKADGIVYGEVWYKLSIEYPKVDIVKEETGNKKEVLSINFLNKSIRLFEGKKYESSIVKKNYLFKNNILPISISKDKMYELKVISGIYTDGEALLNARKYSRRKIEETLKENEYIISDKVLNYRVNSNTIYMDVFYKVYSNITGIKEIVGDNND